MTQYTHQSFFSLPRLNIRPGLSRNAGALITLCLTFAATSAHATPEAKMLSTTIQKIKKMNNATAFEIEADEYQGRRVYEIETLRGGEFYESYIDPETAQILTDEQESTPLWTPLDDEEKQTLAAVKIPLWQAIETIAAEQNASIQSASFMTEGGKSYFEFTLADGARYTVDANAGNVAKC